MPKPDWPYPRLVAHRGGGAFAPENTLEACEVGLRHGYRAAEVDAVLSADEVPVLLHDATLERTTDGRGLVAHRTADELARLDAGSWFGTEFAGVRIPTLVQALHHCRERGMWLNVEIKPVAGFEARTGKIVGEAVARFCADAGPAVIPAPLLSSFSRTALAAARSSAPGIARGLLISGVVADWREALQALACVSLHCDHRKLDAALVQEVKDRGYGLLCYTVNDPARARALWSWGVDAICTDRIDLIHPADEPGLGARRPGGAP
ncbi:glycerophosphodiester phosphodiesterase, cytosolic [Burkholderiales bacterium]|jgi:glycerophosphoryl diester phosphodiesterase|nr:glycerophosphodiester phosphodiesterase, cytosolic [Burkholderiales bacterium]